MKKFEAGSIPELSLVLGDYVLKFNDLKVHAETAFVDGTLGSDVAQGGRVLIDIANGRFELEIEREEAR